MIAMLIAVIIIVIVMNDINQQYCVVRKIESELGQYILQLVTHGSIVLLGLPKYVLPKPLCCYMLQGSKP